MKIFTLSALSLTLICLFSCKKDHDKPVAPPTVPPTVIPTVKISLTNVGVGEIIVTEPTGNIVLDTLGPFTEPLIASLKTAYPLLNITSIQYDTTTKNYTVNTYRSVDLTGWTSLNQASYRVPLMYIPYSNDTMVYTHVPITTNFNALANDFAGNFGFGYGFNGTSLVVNYFNHGKSNYLYMLLPNPALYSFHIPKVPVDTLDYSQMDTAVRVTFIKPDVYSTISSIELDGVMDTADFTKTLLLYQSFYFNSSSYPDLEYPRSSLVKKKQLGLTALGNGNIRGDYYSYGDSITTTLPLTDESAYNLISNQANNFSLKFVSSKPSYYYTRWRNAAINWCIYSSPDSTAFDPQDMLPALKSQLLKTQSLSGLSLQQLHLESVTAFDYAGLLSYTHSPALMQKRRVSSAVGFTKTF
ncbi:MAG TPA: hypothetical protein VK518_16895 [Puia sp.]|nr:hypothetical protein [Puia sp.]